MAELLPVQEAQQRILSSLKPVSQARIRLEEAGGRILAQDIFADIDLPSFDNSSMDGFALQSADTVAAQPTAPVLLDVVGDIPAGTSPTFSIQSGQAARIMTGAPLPDGADAVIPVEDTDHYHHHTPGAQLPEQVQVYRHCTPGDSVRLRGQDIRQGQAILNRGKLLRPQDLGMLAMCGMPEVTVYQRPRVALLASGDELVPPGEPLSPGKVRDANTYVISALVEQADAEIIRLGISPDREDEVRKHLEQACSLHVDLILTSAGVSVGTFDYVRTVIEQTGQLTFWRVNMRPGKPLAFGNYQNIPLIGLPGNPVSSYIDFLVFALPAIQRLSGLAQTTRRTQRVQLAHAVESDGRESYLRARLSLQDGQLTASLTGHQGSGNLFSLVQADALIIIPAGITSLPAGAVVEAWTAY